MHLEEFLFRYKLVFSYDKTLKPETFFFIAEVSILELTGMVRCYDFYDHVNNNNKENVTNLLSSKSVGAGTDQLNIQA